MRLKKLLVIISLVSIFLPIFVVPNQAHALGKKLKEPEDRHVTVIIYGDSSASLLNSGKAFQNA